MEKYNLRDYLMEQYVNFKQISVRKVHGFNGVGLGYKLRMPVIGRIIKHAARICFTIPNPPPIPSGQKDISGR
ncbi:MAG: hypothetical protein U5N58_06435 [Actinomycetota bacterium]|nr:hypothetical protein [Actinomycetota bacterium]